MRNRSRQRKVRWMGERERSEIKEKKGHWRASDSLLSTTRSQEGKNPVRDTSVRLEQDRRWSALSAPIPSQGHAKNVDAGCEGKSSVMWK